MESKHKCITLTVKRLIVLQRKYCFKNTQPYSIQHIAQKNRFGGKLDRQCVYSTFMSHGIGISQLGSMFYYLSFYAPKEIPLQTLSVRRDNTY